MTSPVKAFAAAALLTGLLLGCSSDDPQNPVGPPPGEPSAAWQARLPNLVYQAPTFHPVQVKISNAAAAVDSVKGVITTSGGNPVAEFRLYDDAGAFEYTDALDFCSPWSGDLVAGNGTFTRLVNAGFTGEPGSFILRVTAWVNQQTAQTDPDTISVQLSTPPQISGLTLPDTLVSGFAPLQVSLLAVDPDGPESDSVVVVEMRLYTTGGQPAGDPDTLESLGGGYYGLSLTPDFAAGRPTGVYTFVFRARDTFAMISDSLGREVYLENLAPHLSDLVLPSSVPRPPPGDTTYFALAVRCWDDQSVADIQQVRIRAQKPDPTQWGGYVELFDDGLLTASGDTTAGDSIYTRIVSIYPSNDLGPYVFHFYGDDEAGNQSEISDTLWVVP